MKYTYEHHPAADGCSAHDTFTDELGRTFQHWQMQCPPWAGRHSTAQEVCDFNEWYDALPLGRRTSAWLSEARTVLSRAETALCYVVKDTHAQEISDEDVRELNQTEEDKQIINDLRQVIRILQWTQKTGRAPKYHGGK